MRLGDFDALKAEIALMFGDKTHITESVCELIDNAPTIIWCNQTPEGLPLFDLRERPKGEWSEVFEHLGEKYHKCSECCFGIKLADYDNFCPNCGADMQKGGAE